MQNIIQNPCDAQCPWHGKHPHGRDYQPFEVFPQGICPFLYHALYPYYLGLLYEAKMQDIWVCCPGENGVDCLVRRETNNETFPWIAPDWWVIYAEVVKVGECPHCHYEGQKLLFPTAFKDRYMCPAGLNNLFPFLDLEVPNCINKKNVRCPDWKDNISYEI